MSKWEGKAELHKDGRSWRFMGWELKERTKTEVNPRKQEGQKPKVAQNPQKGNCSERQGTTMEE